MATVALADGSSTTNTSSNPTNTSTDPSSSNSSDTTSTSQPTNNANTTPSGTTTGPQSPTGADANSYTYNPSTGLWENAYYTWNPVTHQTAPKTPQSYSYNPATGMWDTTQWVWNAPKQQYVPNTVSAANGPSITNAAPSSNNSIDQTTNNNANFNLFYNASISNKLNSVATSGSAAVMDNTFAGNGLSGNATSMADVLNMLQSNWNLQGANFPLLFNADINGNVNGDLMINPNNINKTGPNSNANISTLDNNNLVINARGNGAINNDISLDATSGSSTVSNNTNGGDASTGDSHALANVINLLNSAIGAGKSFIGNININGNLNGDILLPPQFLEQLINSSGPMSTVDTSQIVNSNVLANFNNTQAITNNTNLNASSGSATLSNNTNGGSAATGTANTQLNFLNLTGKQIIDANTLLVFVNVLGKWVGMLVNAPSGSNSVAYCGGNCQISSTTNSNATVNETSNNAITNNLKLNSRSGDATVSNNTNGGNARSGNATSAANILNINGSSINASDWFGILFINVNGFWDGSFGTDTLVGSANGGSSNGSTTNGPTVAKVFQFVPDPNSDSKFNLSPLFGYNSSSSGPSAPQAKPAPSHAAQRHSSTLRTNSLKGKAPAWIPGVVAAGVMLAILGVGAIVELNDKLWAIRVSCLQRPTKWQFNFSSWLAKRPSLKMSFKLASLRGWLAGLSWKLPIF